MKADYKGFELKAERGDSVTGIDLVFYSAFRKSDGWELDSGFSYGTVRDSMAGMKATVDDFIKNPKDYDDSGWEDYPANEGG